MPRVPYTAAVPLIRAIYERHGAGCCMHIVTDDFNTDADSVAFCREYAVGSECAECVQCAEVLLTMSETARKKAIRFAFYGGE